MITEYFVCFADSPGSLQTNVNKAIENGWQPFGGIGVNILWLRGEARNVIEEMRLYQAVVKVAKEQVKE